MIDTETTGLIEPKVTEVAKITLTEDFQLQEEYDYESLVNPEKDISYVAMGMTGLTNDMLLDKPKDYEIMGEFNPEPNIKYLVAHNIKFDLKALPDSYDYQHTKVICTLELAKKLVDKEESGDYKNATLFYYLGCHKNPITEYKGAQLHRAINDCVVTASVLKGMLDKYNITLDQAVEMSSSWKTNYKICNFKKHDGKHWKSVVNEDRNYVKWLITNDKFTDEQEKDYVFKVLKNQV